MRGAPIPYGAAPVQQAPTQTAAGRYIGPRAAPLDPVLAARLRARTAEQVRAEEAQVRAQIAAVAALRALAPDIARSRIAAPGPAVSGYRAVAAMIGPDLAARLPGMLEVTGRQPRSTVRGTVQDLFELSPWLRGRAVYRVARAVKAGESAGTIARATRTPHYWDGPAYRAALRMSQARPTPDTQKMQFGYSENAPVVRPMDTATAWRNLQRARARGTR